MSKGSDPLGKDSDLLGKGSDLLGKDSMNDVAMGSGIFGKGSKNGGGAARDAGVRYAIVHRDQLMEDHYVEAAGALKRHASLLAEDERMRIYALY